jgi:hypothetical protein
MGKGIVRAWTLAALVACGGSDAEPVAPPPRGEELPPPAPPPGEGAPPLGAGAPPGQAPPGGSPATPPSSTPFLDPNFRVWFRLDVSATPVEAEDRWVSPSRHLVRRAGDAVVLDALARVVDAGTGVPADVAAAWTPSNPRMVAVVPRRADRVALEVRLEGRSAIAVRHAGQTRLLTVVAEREGADWRVEILQ